MFIKMKGDNIYCRLFPWQAVLKHRNVCLDRNINVVSGTISGRSCLRPRDRSINLAAKFMLLCDTEQWLK
jgi:hypothetical protein